ncbi:hypothetical protein bpr_I0649 [Butyrivibrio proteoclasticus B316]|uniref:Uncharacterized protein n=1 Tax=Butyrivibrio proteoclasticus (strain ATCC 51982 / DSM 14932 / B316) TaxID=515622 RepID=E0S0S0_BUTPB|nr:hypothetical protein bpr_I0649 [Butyrivibrio proteoclasticus B316]
MCISSENVVCFRKKPISGYRKRTPEERARERRFSLLTVNYLEWAEWSGRFYKKHGYKEYVQDDEETCPDLKSQVAFLKKIGRLNNGDKHLVWKTIF